MKIIAMAGLAQTGKSTAADYLVEKHGFIELAFAGPLKKMLAALIDCEVEDLEVLKNEYLVTFGCTGRELMQTLGTEWGRETIRKSFWVNQLLEKIIELSVDTQDLRVVITDCRFDNEADAIRDSGGLVLHVRRPDAPELPAHASEEGVAIRSFDAMIVNEADKDYLYHCLDTVVEAYDSLIEMRDKYDGES